MMSIRALRTFVLLVIVLTLTTNIGLTLTVNNQLVPARNDCFERLALEAMLPFEKSFHTHDINSLKICKEKCLEAGDRCQTFAFGVHRRGNGTCQLSSEKMGNIKGRPMGVIFDPDFDLYVRKINCFNVNSNTMVGDGPTYENVPQQTQIALIQPINGQKQSIEPGASVWTVSPTNSLTPTTTAAVFVNEHFQTTGMVNENPFDTSQQPTDGTTFESSSQGDGDRLYFTHEVYPLYKYPMLYEQNYPAPNDEILPAVYASNVPVLENHNKPEYELNGVQHLTTGKPIRPVFEHGYGTGYTQSKPGTNFDSSTQPYASNGITFSTTTNNKSKFPFAQSTSQGGSEYLSRPEDVDYPASTYDQNHQTRPYSNHHHSHYQHRDHIHPTARPSNVNVGGYTSNPHPIFGSESGTPLRSPKPQQNGYNGQQQKLPHGYNSDLLRRNYSSATKNTDRLSGYNYNDDKTIATYFVSNGNIEGNRRGQFDGGFGVEGLYNGPAYDTNPSKACFRRVLAGKRIAPHWVRRTIACERVEECMRECGHEKRFICEGFNYRLDPSGHGQGDCELIEIPLAHMDLYSSPHQRDSNLLRHPDYDYYERDRNAPSSCRKNTCKDCSKPISSPTLYFKPPTTGWSDKSHSEEHYSISAALPPSKFADHLSSHRYRPLNDPTIFRARPLDFSYDSRPDSHSSSYEFSSHGFSSSGSGGDQIDRYDINNRDENRYWGNKASDRWQAIPSSHGHDDTYQSTHEQDRFRSPYRPGSNISPYKPTTHHHHHHDFTSQLSPPDSHNAVAPLDHHIVQEHKDNHKFIPYLIDSGNDWSSYGSSYGGYSNDKISPSWGEEYRRKGVQDFNYFDLGAPRHPSQIGSSILNSRYGGYGLDRHDYRHQWTRRPGPDECSAKTGEGFRLHKTAVKQSFKVPTITECEHLCSTENEFICHTYSYRYTQVGRENCMLCERPVNLLDYYVDIEPDRDYDIYSMADDLSACRHPSRSDTTALSDPKNAQCFFRAIDSTRFFKSIVRDSLTVRSVGECELECIKSTKFTCRAFAYRYGQRRHLGIIDNCQLSDWPVRDMDKGRHLIHDISFDVFERASYGHGCEIQPIVDDKHKKLCYLGYGSPAKLLSAAIKKVITVSSELECKKECIRHRETTSFKCYSFSFGAHATAFNCEMSDLDQTELQINIHYGPTPDRNYWLFAWNPFDWTCRDKVNTIGGTRVKNDRRMDIFREPGDVAWRHYTVSGKACRLSSPCEKNLVTGFYSCETDGGEIGSWDYCCKADHICGYSQGFDYPWCFVGDEPDQWRKCSDRYYPGNKTHHSHASITVRPFKDQKKKVPHSNTHEFQRPPRPGGLQSFNDFTAARLWPVTYLYSEGPPNSTEFSNFVDCNKETC